MQGEFGKQPSEKRQTYLDMLTAYMELTEDEKENVGYDFTDFVYECEYRGVDCLNIS